MPELEIKKNTRARRLWPLTIATAVPAVLTAVFYILRGDKALMDDVTENFSAPARGFLGDITAPVPFSLMELLCAALILWGLWHIVRTILLVCRRKGQMPGVLIRRVLALAAVLLWICCGNCWLWYTGYYATDFSEKSGLDSEGVSTGELVAVARFFVERAGTLSAQVARDADRHYAERYDDYSARIYSVYDPIVETFPALDGVTRTPKEMLFSRLMSRIGFTGFYFALTGETNINTDVPGCLIPATLAHEAAHQRGVQSEDEANFAAIAACITSGDTVYMYSGYLKGAINLMNALYSAAPDEWRALYSGFTPEMHTDWADNNEYWASMETKVSEISDTVYDAYLKSNAQELGIKSYGACVDLLIEWLIVDGGDMKEE